MRNLEIRTSKPKSPRVTRGRHKGYQAKKNTQHNKRMRLHLLRAPK